MLKKLFLFFGRHPEPKAKNPVIFLHAAQEYPSPALRMTLPEVAPHPVKKFWQSQFYAKNFTRIALWGLGLWAILAYLRHYRIEGDTVALVNGVSAMWSCMKQGHWAGCPGVLHFPLLQQLPALFLTALGLNKNIILRLLVLLNLALFLQMMRSSWRNLASSSQLLANSFVFVLLAGPLLWYARSSFGEMLATFCTLNLVMSFLTQTSPAHIFIWFLLAGISKETAFPFLLLLSMAAWSLKRGTQPRYFRRHPLAILIPALVVVLTLNTSLNYFRFASPINTFLLNTPVLRVPNWEIQWSFFAGIWLSPNGGVLFFWFPMFTMLVLCLWTAAKTVFGDSVVSGKKLLTRLAPAIAVLLTLFGLTWGFSHWFAPMGWVALGPRLLLPWLPAVAYLMLSAYPGDVEKVILTLFENRNRAIAVYIAMVFCTLPQFVILFKPSLLDVFFLPDKNCPRIADVMENVDYYYACINHLLWFKKPLFLKCYSVFFGNLPIFLLSAFSAVNILALLPKWGKNTSAREPIS
ncbi:MAG TPA: hypothetical protein P5079_08500 [Elusimicrobiota bacterium]|nr:hypothetical protein [Elusimicrobiota bacterium]